MADYKIPNLCGASVQFNALQSKFDDMINTAASPAGLIADAASLATSLTPNVTSLLDEAKKLLPELPSLPDVNLQAELTSLASLPAGSFEHGTLLAEITTKFGTALTTGGFSLDTLVSDAAAAITGGTDLCGAVPNFTVPAAGGAAVQIANGVLQPEGGSVTEKASVLIKNANFIAMKAAVEETFATYEEIGEEVPNEDIGPYRVTEETTSIARASAPGANIKAMSDDEIRTPKPAIVTTQKATTPKNAVKVSSTTTKTTADNPDAGKEEQERANTVDPEKSAGFVSQPVFIKEEFKENDVTKSGNTYKITLSHHPINTVAMRGYVPKYKKIGKNGETYKGRSRIIIQSNDELFADDKDIYDQFVLNGKEITITGKLHEYGASPRGRGYMFTLNYDMVDNYDPNYAGPIKQ